MNSGPVLADAMLPAGQRVACDAPASHRTKTFAPIRTPAKTGITGQSVWGKLQFAKRTDFEFSIPAEKLQLHLNRSSDQLSPRTPPAIVHPE
jgi:hypothetical protein